MTAGLEERAEYEAAKKDEKRAKTKERIAKLRLKIKRDEEKIKDYMAKLEYIEEKHIGRMRMKIEHLNGKIKELKAIEFDVRARRVEETELGAARRDEKKAKRERQIARYRLRISSIEERIKYYITKMEFIEEKHIQRLKDRIARHKNKVKESEHTKLW
jgi:hypothetical protein